MIAVAFLLASAVPYLHPVRYWPLSFLGLGFPLLLALLIVFFIFWLFFKIRYCLISLLAIALGWKAICTIIAFNWPGPSTTLKKPHSLQVMSYNVSMLMLYNEKGEKEDKQKIIDLIKAEKPDIACFQEFVTLDSYRAFDYKDQFTRKLNMPYRYFASDFNVENNHWGSIIYSKYPILHAVKKKMLPEENAESLIYADILFEEDTIRVYNMHLQSVRFDKTDYETLQKIANRRDIEVAGSKNIFLKLKTGFLKRCKQADMVATEVRQSPYPAIVCGDFNDTPNSYAYATIRGNLEDAFLEKGWGVGRTFSSISPTLRIDYILADRQFKVCQYKKINRRLSDHYPIVANLVLKKSENGPAAVSEPIK